MNRFTQISRITSIVLLSWLFLSTPSRPSSAQDKPVIKQGIIKQTYKKTTPNTPQTFPDLKLSRHTQGIDAVAALSNRIPEVAAWYGRSSQGLSDLLRKDKTLWLDKKARLHFREKNMIDPAQAAAAPLSSTSTALAAAPFAPEQTFLLHSKPTSKRVIYLDFNGAALSNCVWTDAYTNGQPITAPAWDMDGNPLAFGPAELERIQFIWQRVAEDFSPFDVDITTEQPLADRITRTNTADEYYGTWVLISPISSLIGNYGGIAYVGIFDYTGNYYKPALVFPEKLLNSEKYIAEAITHETGHNLGLYHQGTTSGAAYYNGHGSWAPIMGNSYYKDITQWSKGEYSGANNTENELALIQSHGLNYAADAHGNSTGTASALVINGNAVSGQGVIEQDADMDLFKFASLPGTVQLTVNPAARTSNLHLKVELKDSNGTVLAAAAVKGILPATLTASLPGGTCYLSIEGTGEADPLTTGYSGYGSLGQYYISGTIPSAIIYGDASGDGAVTIYDAILVARYSVGQITLTAQQETVAK